MIKVGAVGGLMGVHRRSLVFSRLLGPPDFVLGKECGEASTDYIIGFSLFGVGGISIPSIHQRQIIKQANASKNRDSSISF